MTIPTNAAYAAMRCRSKGIRLGVAISCFASALLLAGCGPGEELASLQMENEKLGLELEQTRVQVNELRSSLGEIRSRLEDISANIRIGAYARYGRSLSKDLDEVIGRIVTIDSKADDAASDLR